MNYNTDNEIWKDINGYEGLYQISNLGIIKSIKRNIILKQIINGSGYFYIRLCKEGKYERFFIHKLIAEYFIENKENKKEVNHIDHNKLNNDISNLEWCTREENIKAMYNFYNNKINKCECGKEIKFRTIKCNECSNYKNYKRKEKPTKEELKELTKKYPFVELARMFGVSDNAVRKWCKNYGIEYRKRLIK